MRRVLGVSKELHDSIKRVSEELSLPMTVVLEALLVNYKSVDWEKVRSDYNYNKPTWENMRRIVGEYQRAHPGASDEELSELTGFSLAQVETITHTAHRRCIKFMSKGKYTPKRIAEECEVSLAFAKRIAGQYYNGDKVPRGEKHLFL